MRRTDCSTGWQANVVVIVAVTQKQQRRCRCANFALKHFCRSLCYSRCCCGCCMSSVLAVILFLLLASLSFGPKKLHLPNRKANRAPILIRLPNFDWRSAQGASCDASVRLPVWLQHRHRHRHHHRNRLWLLLQAVDKRRLTTRTLNGVPPEPEPISRHLYCALVFIAVVSAASMRAPLSSVLAHMMSLLLAGRKANGVFQFFCLSTPCHKRQVYVQPAVLFRYIFSIRIEVGDWKLKL